MKVVMAGHGAVHVQIGKSYNYLPSREPRIAQDNLGVRLAIPQERKAFGILRDANAIGVQHDVPNGAALGGGDNLQYLRVNAGLAAR